MDSRLLGCTDEGQAGAGDTLKFPVPYSTSGLCLCVCTVAPGQPVPTTHTQAARLRGRIRSSCPKQILHRVVEWGRGAEGWGAQLIPA